MTLYLISVAVAAVWLPINILCFRYIAAHSDGGGHDAGTSYTFHPYLRREYSVSYDNEDVLGWYGAPAGKKAISILLTFVPCLVVVRLALWVVLFLVPLLWWVLFPNDVHRSSEFDTEWTTRKIDSLW